MVIACAVCSRVPLDPLSAYGRNFNCTFFKRMRTDKIALWNEPTHSRIIKKGEDDDDIKDASCLFQHLSRVLCVGHE